MAIPINMFDFNRKIFLAGVCNQCASGTVPVDRHACTTAAFLDE